MNDYLNNKASKDAKLSQLIRKTITVNRKEIGLEFEDVAHELGMQPGTLQNKLKPAMQTNDMSITEFVHFLELTGDYSALEYIANKFDCVLVHKKQAQASHTSIKILVDTANIENAEVFKAVTIALSDGNISDEEREIILKEIDEAQKANAELKDLVQHLGSKE
jgi:hypothetical protein